MSDDIAQELKNAYAEERDAVERRQAWEQRAVEVGIDPATLDLAPLTVVPVEIDYDALNKDVQFLYDSAHARGKNAGAEQERRHLGRYHARTQIEVAIISLGNAIQSECEVERFNAGRIARRILNKTPLVAEGISQALAVLRQANLNDSRLKVIVSKLEEAHQICTRALDELGGAI